MTDGRAVALRILLGAWFAGLVMLLGPLYAQRALADAGDPPIVNVPAFESALAVPPGFIQGSKWGSATMGTGAVVTYSYDTSQGSEVALDSFMPAGYRTYIGQALSAWSDVADIQFVEVPSGGDLRLVGGAIDGPGSVGANATYPDAGYNRVRFDSGNDWYINPDGTNNIREITMHELGHAIGLLHPPGILARMDHHVTNAFQGLLPTDVAAIQAVYGPALGSDPSDYMPGDITQFTILPSSSLRVQVQLDPFINLTRTTRISGSLDTGLVLAGDGSPSAFTVYGADAALTDTTFTVNTSAIQAQVLFSGLEGDLLSTDWFGPSGHLTPVVGGNFSPLAVILGLVGGEASYDVQSAILGLDESGLFNFEYVNTTGAGPQSFKPFDDGQIGHLTRNGSVVDLELPIRVETTLDLPSPIGDVPVTIRARGTIFAQAIVPEPSTWVLAVSGVAALGLALRRRRRL
ncbi:MAG: matrixin family metalloprotease [Pirellulales bacterium]|nr:matrixin family metalloprotease [Pirellulales bacterium]